MQYVGEIYNITSSYGKKKLEEYKSNSCTYLMSLSDNEVIDPTFKGNLARFINHSCDPNCLTQKWYVLGEQCIGIFTLRDVNENEELTFNYNFDIYKTTFQKCLCGSINCKGYLGVAKNETIDRMSNSYCRFCKNNVKTSDKIIACESCSKIFHFNCTKKSKFNMIVSSSANGAIPSENLTSFFNVNFSINLAELQSQTRNIFVCNSCIRKKIKKDKKFISSPQANSVSNSALGVIGNNSNYNKDPHLLSGVVSLSENINNQNRSLLNSRDNNNFNPGSSLNRTNSGLMQNIMLSSKRNSKIIHDENENENDEMLIDDTVKDKSSVRKNRETCDSTFINNSNNVNENYNNYDNSSYALKESKNNFIKMNFENMQKDISDSKLACKQTKARNSNGFDTLVDDVAQISVNNLKALEEKPENNFINRSVTEDASAAGIASGRSLRENSASKSKPKETKNVINNINNNNLENSNIKNNSSLSHNRREALLRSESLISNKSSSKKQENPAVLVDAFENPSKNVILENKNSTIMNLDNQGCNAHITFDNLNKNTEDFFKSDDEEDDYDDTILDDNLEVDSKNLKIIRANLNSLSAIGARLFWDFRQLTSQPKVEIKITGSKNQISKIKVEIEKILASGVVK